MIAPEVHAAAEKYAKLGWRIVIVHVPGPGGCSCGKADCGSPGKHPRQTGWTDAVISPAMFANGVIHNIGIITGTASGVVVIDVDAGGEETLSGLERAHGPLPSTVTARTGGGGRHIYLKRPGVPIKNDVKKRLGPGLDVRGEGGFVVATPSLHASGNYYEWLPGAAPWEREVAEMPAWVLALLREPERVTPPARPASSSSAYTRAAHYLARMPQSISGSGGHDALFAAAQALVRGFRLSSAEALSLLTSEFNPRCEPPWSEKELEHKVDDATNKSTLPWGYLLDAEPAPHTAGGARPTRSREPGEDDGEEGTQDSEHTRASGAPTGSIEPDVDDDGKTGALTDWGNARRFVERAGGRFLYVHEMNRWFRYDGRRWVKDASRQTHELAVQVARSYLADAARAKTPTVSEALIAHALRSQKKERIDGMIAVAANSFAEVKALPAQLDADPWVLNCKNGTLDLRTGVLRKHNRIDLITKLVPIAYKPGARAPTWVRFLSDVLPDEETRKFLQRGMGYSATGSTVEHVVFFLFGSGRNGKSVLIDTMMAVLGDYAVTPPPGLLLVKKSEQHPTELTTLVGKRFASTIEAGKGKAWDEARLKWLTGGDRLTARGMRQDFFEFEPSHKFWVAANHRPRVIGTDTGIWARIKEIPFTQEFRDADDTTPSRQRLPVKDKDLKAKLLAEGEGILVWIVAGCLEWQLQGLGVPAVVRAAVEDYRAEEDELRPFLDSYEPLKTGAKVPLQEVADAYRAFAGRSGEAQLSNRDLAAALRERGYIVRPGAKGYATVFPPSRSKGEGDDG